MKVKNAILTLIIAMGSMVFGASQNLMFTTLPDKNEERIANTSMLPHASLSATFDENNSLEIARLQHLCEISKYGDQPNASDLVGCRWFFRKVANFSAAAGNTFFYCGSGLSTIAAATTGIYPDATNYLLIASMACSAINLALFSIARYCADGVSKREAKLKKLATKSGFNLISLAPNIVNYRDLTTNPNMA